MDQDIFISHSSKNDDTVKKLRETLEREGFSIWIDSRELKAGTSLSTAIKSTIHTARHFLVVISNDALNSKWVMSEVGMALQEAEERTDGYSVIPVVLPGVQPGLLKTLFPEDLPHIFVDDTPTGLSDAMPKIFAALRTQLPTDWDAAKMVQTEREEVAVFSESSAFSLLVDPGTASPEEVSELLTEISTLYRLLGGSGITFTPTEIKDLEVA